MLNIERIVDEFFKENGLETRLSFNMPIGYETAFGTYDVTINTLFFNDDMLSEAPEFETLFFLFHELRHALQYNFPEKFENEKRIFEANFELFDYENHTISLQH